MAHAHSEPAVSHSCQVIRKGQRLTECESVILPPFPYLHRETEIVVVQIFTACVCVCLARRHIRAGRCGYFKMQQVPLSPLHVHVCDRACVTVCVFLGVSRFSTVSLMKTLTFLAVILQYFINCSILEYFVRVQKKHRLEFIFRKMNLKMTDTNHSKLLDFLPPFQLFVSHEM